MKKLFIILFSSALAVGCNKQIDEIRPLTKIDQEGELSSVTGIVEATLGNYTLLEENTITTRSFHVIATANLFETRGNTVTIPNFSPNIDKETDAFYFRNSPGATLGYSDEFYRGSYNGIVSVNTVLEGIEKMEKTMFPSFSETDRNRVLYAKGENRFLRAMTYFNLIRLFGKPYYQDAATSPGVPLKLTSDLTDNPERATVKEVYEFITDELKVAAQLMKVPVSKTNSFISTGAAWALLSRVYLYMGGSISSPDATFNQWSISYADSVINHGGGAYELIQGNDYRNLFANDEFGSLGRAKFADNKEIIFAYDHELRGGYLALMFNYDPFVGNDAIFFLPSSDLKQSLVPDDIRSTFYRTNPANGKEETTKHLAAFAQGTSRAPNIYFRIGETYLNRAEAYAKSGDFTNAKADLKAIHTRAGLPASDIDAIADQDLITAILEERRIELAFEGHASFDNFRNGLPMTRIAVDNNGNALTIQPDDPKVTFTIPAN